MTLPQSIYLTPKLQGSDLPTINANMEFTCRKAKDAEGAIVPNEPNWRRQRTCGLGGIDVPDPGPGPRSRAGTPELRRNAWRTSRAQSSRVTTSAPADQLCETNPIGPEPNASQVPCGTAVMSVSACEGLRKTNPIGSTPRGSGIPPVSPDHGRDAHATELTDPPMGQSCKTNPICAGSSGGGSPNESCETNPIGPEPNTSQVLGGTAVMSDSACEGCGKQTQLGARRVAGHPSRRSPIMGGSPLHRVQGRL